MSCSLNKGRKGQDLGISIKPARHLSAQDWNVQETNHTKLNRVLCVKLNHLTYLNPTGAFNINTL